jgi:enoyl-CoA hydratase/carnithine racemase
MTQGEVWEFLDQFRESLGILESLPIPVIAGINGSAYGGGLEIALACDFRLVSSGAELGLTEARLGIIPGAGGTQRLPRIIGLARAKEMIYFGLKISATRAYEWNLVHRVIDANRFTEEVLQFAREIEKSAPISIAGVKQSINQGFSLALEEGLDLERNQYKRTIDSQDRVEALRAFQEKREPKFRGE